MYIVICNLYIYLFSCVTICRLLSSSLMTNITVLVHFDKIISHAQLHAYFEEYLQINSYLFESRQITSIYSEGYK